MLNRITKILFVSIILILLFVANVIAETSTVTKPLPKGAILCVSLGMPDEVLRQYLKQAHALNIPLVIRGMLDNNMKATSGRLFELLNPPNEAVINGGIAIDPRPFKIAHIQAVPALIVSDGYQFDTVTGNAPLNQLLNIIEKDGSSESIKQVAKSCQGDQT